MGTSSKYKGTSDGLVPTWADKPKKPTKAPSGANSAGGGASSSGGSSAGGGKPASALSNQPGTGTPTKGGSLRGSRNDFNKFARGKGRSYLRRAAGRYVRSGMGGAGTSMRAMGSSRAVGNSILAFANAVAGSGATQALREFNLDQLANAPIAAVFPQLLERLCPPGGTIDEAIARQAYLDAVGDLCEGFNGTLAELRPDQLRDLVLDFIAHSIEGRLLNDIGTKLVELSSDVNELGALSDDMRDFVGNCVRNSIGTLLDNMGSIPDNVLQQATDQIYQATFTLIDSYADES